MDFVPEAVWNHIHHLNVQIGDNVRVVANGEAHNIPVTEDFFARQERLQQEAKEKARRLLYTHLNREQIYTLEGWGFFYVRGADKRMYALFDGYWIAVMSLGPGSSIQPGRRIWQEPGRRIWQEPGRRIWKANQLLGAHPTTVGSIPQEDSLLAQKLMLETDPSWVWHISCKWAIEPYSPIRIPAAVVTGRLDNETRLPERSRYRPLPATLIPVRVWITRPTPIQDAAQAACQTFVEQIQASRWRWRRAHD